MTQNPFLNAFFALLYITLVGLFMNFASKFAPKGDTIITSIAVISLFTLSAAVMASLFGLKPVMLYLDGKKKIAVKLFLQTIACFALFTFSAPILVFFI
jgi:hypothetical protein